MRMQTVLFQDLGNMGYKAAWDYQTLLHKQLVEHKLQHRHEPPETLAQAHQFLVVEHPPVFTLGKSGSMEHLLLDESGLAQHGIQFFPINRGGDITFHGPGQIVGYPILDLECFFTDVHRYVRSIEDVIIRTLSDFGLEGTRIKEFTGVWLEGPPARAFAEEETDFFTHRRKICAIGVHLSRWVSLHGFALNVNTDLHYFDYIVPCGIRDGDKNVTSMARELGYSVEMKAVTARLKVHFADVFACDLHEGAPLQISTHHE